MRGARTNSQLLQAVPLIVVAVVGLFAILLIVKLPFDDGPTQSLQGRGATALGNDATCVDINAPGDVRPGAKFNVTVSYTNTGTSTWDADDTTPHRIGSQEPQDNTLWTGSNRVGLSSSVSPGALSVNMFEATAPTTPGSYNLSWQMVEDGAEWFGEACKTAVTVSPECLAEQRRCARNGSIESCSAGVWVISRCANPNETCTAGACRPIAIPNNITNTTNSSSNATNSTNASALLMVWVHSPADNSIVSGVILVNATVSSTTTVAGVRFYLNGIPLGNEKQTPPFAVNWNTSVVSDGQYLLFAVVRSSANITNTSANITIRVNNTVPATPDTQAPHITIIAPANNTTVAGNVTITANATDNIGVAGVQFRINGASAGSEDTVAPYSLVWNSTAVPDGLFNITAVARDAANNTNDSSQILLRVNNTANTMPSDTAAPTVNITRPAAHENVSGIITINASAADNIGVALVQFRLDGNDFGAPDTAAPYSITWNTTAAADGAHTWSAVAKDTANNTGMASVVTVMVNNTPPDTTRPSVAIAGPANDTNVSGELLINATATDASGIRYVQFFANATLISTDNAAPFSAVWNTSNVSEGAYLLVAQAQDMAGNNGTSVAIAVKVNRTLPVNVVVDSRPPTVAITAPQNNSIGAGVILITATADDDKRVNRVQFKLDGINLGQPVPTAPYAINWNSSSVSDGTYALSAMVWDDSQKNATSTPVTVRINNSAPQTGDADEDGVLDVRDQCLGTPKGVTVDIRGCKAPITNTFSLSLTTDLRAVDSRNVSNFTIGTERVGKITFGRNVSLVRANEAANLSAIIELRQNGVRVNTTALPSLNVSAEITLFNVTNVTMPRILRDGIPCSDCIIKSFINNTLVFTVPHFTEYVVVQRTCGDGVCDAAESCSTCSADCGSCRSGGGRRSTNGSGDITPYWAVERNDTVAPVNRTTTATANRTTTWPSKPTVNKTTSTTPSKTNAAMPVQNVAPEVPNIPQTPPQDYVEIQPVMPPEEPILPIEPEPAPTQYFTYVLAGIIITVLVFGTLGFIEYERHQHRQREAQPQDDLLQRYIGAMRAKGMPEDDIKARLLSVGWEQQVVEERMRPR